MEETSARNISSKTTESSASLHPCYCLQLAIKKLLGCLGLYSTFNDLPNEEGEMKATEERSISSLDASLSSRRPKPPVIDPGRGGQTN
ncbi:hypothetical protein MRB53_000086 [Persea americana]|uniref:Uncharacterized protein n=1 Tax=Persea americana TaxID=3435 RepID=A0ACC2MN61_PERAE|nr:hypothetical protein MRB53_000086 [Persea americana]